MNDGKRKRIARIRRHRRVRKKVVGTAECPRLGVFRSNRHIYVQLIDDEAGRVMAEASTMSRDLRDKIKADSSKTEAAKVVGAAIAERATAASVSPAATRPRISSCSTAVSRLP